MKIRKFTLKEFAEVDVRRDAERNLVAQQADSPKLYATTLKCQRGAGHSMMRFVTIRSLNVLRFEML